MRKKTLAPFLALITVISLLALSPRLLHSILTPLAHSCTREFYSFPYPELGVGGQQLSEYEWCEFGLPQPFEVIVAMLASGSPASAFVATLLLMLLGAVSGVAWATFRKKVSG
jgi:hypothetical protein